jgi:hypothetical protein
MTALLLKSLAADSCIGEVTTNVLKAIDSLEPSTKMKCIQRLTEYHSLVKSGPLILGTENSSPLQ